MKIEQLVDLVRRIKWVQSLEKEIERLEESKQRIKKAQIENSNLESAEFCMPGNLWDMSIPIALVPQVTDMVIWYYGNYRRETQDYLDSLMVLTKEEQQTFVKNHLAEAESNESVLRKGPSNE